MPEEGAGRGKEGMAGRGEREGLQKRMRTLLGGTDIFIILLYIYIETSNVYFKCVQFMSSIPH